MPFIVLNSSNAFDPNNQTEFSTETEADAKAREIMQAFPQSVVRTAQLLNTYSAKVTVSVKAVPEVQAVPDTADASA
ncbi:hypothetical protein AO262_36495 [Pseudomonas fluorescens ABAC62]|nr:hypothetical protein AO262_36495 [Pseudomonas fluorescens ABAC62]